MKKRLFAVFFAVILVFFSTFLLSGGEPLVSEKPALSSLPEEDQLSFLNTYGIEIPEGYTVYVTSLIAMIEKDPDYPIAISNPVTYDIALQVKHAVNDYYRQNADPMQRSARHARPF